MTEYVLIAYITSGLLEKYTNMCGKKWYKKVEYINKIDQKVKYMNKTIYIYIYISMHMSKIWIIIKKTKQILWFDVFTDCFPPTPDGS